MYVTGLLLLLTTACTPADRPRITELLYDAIGDDTGWEFVELTNPRPDPVALTGLRLESGDGSGPGRWSLRWTGTAADTIRGHARFVIGGARVTPAPDAVATLDLQNGPDAIRLVWPDGTSEVVGYGGHEFAEYSCGAPAVDVASGQSLARVPDDADTGGNATDFRAAAPTPGAANRPERDAGWVPGSLALDPERPDPGTMATLRGTIANLGAQSIAGANLTIRVHAAGLEIGTWTGDAALAAGESLGVAIPIASPSPGRYTLDATIELAGDQSRGNDRDTLAFRSGPGPLEITEIQFHPGRGEGEWVEVRNRDGTAVDPAAFTLSDRGAARGRPAWLGTPLEPGAYAVFAQDRAAWLAAFPAADSTRVAEVRPWAALNNGNDESGVADHVVVREDAVPSDRVEYSAAGVPAGVPIERAADGTWRPAVDGLGSPLAPARELPPLAATFEVRPGRVAAGGALLLAWSLPWRARMWVDAFDLRGDRVQRVLPETRVAARGEQRWDTTGLAPGVYVLRLHARPEAKGDAEVGASGVVRVSGSAR